MDIPRRLVLAGGLAAVALKPENPLVAGTVLRRAAIQSPNFAAGVSGWTIKQDGSAEFNNVTIRGTVIAGHFIGTGEGQEVLIYSGTPAAGNLIASICSAAGTDAQGNAFLAGIADYKTAAPVQAISNDGGVIRFWTAATEAGPWTQNFTIAQVSAAQLDIAPQTGGFTSLSSDPVQIAGVLRAITRAAPGTPAAGIGDLYVNSTDNLWHYKSPSGFDGTIPGSQADTTDRTVTQAVSTQLGANFAIPANDPVAGMTYRYRAGGTGQWGSTQQQLTLIDQLTGGNANQVNVAATAFAISAPVDWELDIQVTIKTTGAGGTCNVRMRLSISVNNAAANSGNGVIAVRRTAGVAINTIVANSLQLNALWASTTGAPTITCNNSTFERIGP